MNNKLDLITIGRSSIDLYGSQVGGRLEDMGSFNKYIGGSQRQSLVGNPLQYQTLGLNISKQMAREVG
jgi:5-dehydro-2-deoxygluconokinase